MTAGSHLLTLYACGPDGYSITSMGVGVWFEEVLPNAGNGTA